MECMGNNRILFTQKRQEIWPLEVWVNLRTVKNIYTKYRKTNYYFISCIILKSQLMEAESIPGLKGGINEKMLFKDYIIAVIR